MGFKENLVQKIQIDRLADAVVRSVADNTETGVFDRASMEKLLAMGGYPHTKARDLDLYILADKLAKKRILVLDNGLAIYESTVEDVAMRKSPTVKEMVSFRNAFKILNDSDVLISKRETSVRTLQKSNIDRLDLSYTAEDIAAIGLDGTAALQGRDGDGVLEALALFAELLQMKPAPKAFRLPNQVVMGLEETSATGLKRFGPIVVYDPNLFKLYLIAEAISPDSTDRMKHFQAVASGSAGADREGASVFQYLVEKVPAVSRYVEMSRNR